MTEMQPKPQAQLRHQKQVAEQIPRAKLHVIFRMDGISAEPLLIYRNTSVAEKAGWGKTSFYPSQNTDTMPPAQQRHQKNVGQTAQTLAPNVDRQQEIIARNTHLQNVAKEQTGSPVKHQEKEQQQHERER